jgi:putative peptide zinc metalloprotease protein
VLQLVLPDGRRVVLSGEVTIGRASANTVHLADETVSRQHASVSCANGTPVIEDAGSSSGTWVDGRRIDAPAPLQDGMRIALGDVDLVVERPRSADEAGLTVVVPDGASALLPAAARGPRLLSGYALKRLEAAEGERRWVLKSMRSDQFVRLADLDAELVILLDGRRSTSELVLEAERLLGPGGPPRLAGLLAELADRGLLANVDERPEAPRPAGRLRRLIGPREVAWPGAGDAIERLQRPIGDRLVSETAATAIAIFASVGIGVFAFLVAGRYGTPFVVARKVGLGAFVFIVGRLAIAAVHEAAHGVVMASYGRRVHRAGLKLIAIFPYVYVDTSDAWFEPRRRRIAISAAGPASDFTLAALFSLCCLALAPGAVRDVFFQLAFAAYVGAIFNLNPFVERDGYHILVDVLGEPGLRRRAREQLRRRMSGGARESGLLERYSVLGLAWTVVALGFGVIMSLRYEAVLAQLVPPPVAHLLLAFLWLLLLAPLAGMVGEPLLQRVRQRGVSHGGA